MRNLLHAIDMEHELPEPQPQGEATKAAPTTIEEDQTAAGLKQRPPRVGGLGR